MSFDVSDLPSPENRTAAQWVTFYLRLENAVAQGETVSVGNRSVSMPDLEVIRKTRKDWENQIGKDATESSNISRYAPTFLGGC